MNQSVGVCDTTDSNNKSSLSQNDVTSNCPVMMKLPSKLRDRLLPFQKDGVRFAESKNGRCLIADEMGLGKTIQAISVAYIYKSEWPLLIIVPSSLKFCWIEELEKWLPDILPHEINLVQGGSDISGMAVCPITIVTYGLLRLPSSKVIREALSTRRFQVVICDESHYLKNINTSSCKTVIPILKMANRRLLLSGTPALAKPVELYPQIDAICPGKFGSFWQYTDRYCDAHTKYFGKFRKRQVDGASHLEELQQKLQSMMIRREKSDVLTELPPKQRQKIMFELKCSPLKKEILEAFAELKQSMQKGDGTIKQGMDLGDLHLDGGLNLPNVESPSSNDRASSGVYSLISRLYKLSGEAKIGPVREYIEMLCEDEQLKFLVFAYHHDMMDGIQQTLGERKVKFVRIDGSTRSSDRQMFVNQFQSDPETRVAILSILAAGVGLTLTAAKLVVFSELYWTPGVMAQCEDRAHRIGQTSSLPVHYLVARDTMDEWVWSALCRKTLVTSTALTGRTKHLDHGKGTSHQTELLSNADMWKLEEGAVDVAELVQSQRAGDQSSILEFFKSQRSPEFTPTRKRKHHLVSAEVRSPFPGSQASPALDKPRCQDFRQEMSDLKKKKLKSLAFAKGSDFILVSDDENDFKPAGNTKKNEHRKTFDKKRTKLRKPKKTVQAEIRTANNKRLEKCDSLGLVASVESPTFDLHFCEDSESLPAKVDCSDESSLLSDDLSFYAVEGKISLDKKPKDESNGNFCCFSGVGEVRALSEPVIDTDTSPKQMAIHSSGKCISSPSATDYFQCSFDELLETPQGHSSPSVPKERQTEVTTRPDQWSCSICTFLNHPELPHCEQCDTPKKKPIFARHQEYSPTEHGYRRKLSQILNSPEVKDSPTMTKSTAEKHDSKPTDSPSPRKQPKKQPTYSHCTSLKPSCESPSFGQIVHAGSGDQQNKNGLVPNSCTSRYNNDDSQTELKLVSKYQGTVSDSDVSSQTKPPQYRSPSQLTNLSPSIVAEAVCINSNQSAKLLGVDSVIQLHVPDFPNTEKAPRGVQPRASEHSECALETLTSPVLCTTAQNGSPVKGSAALPATSLMAQPPEESCSASDCQPSSDHRPNPYAGGTNLQPGTHDNPVISSHSVLRFSCSIHTGRIYVYDENDQFMKASFHPVDIEMGNTGELPEVLHKPHSLRLLQKFVREWSSLTDTKKKLIAKRCQVFTSPHAAYDTIKTVHGSKQRHLSKQDTLATALKTAARLQGSIQVISKHAAPANLDTECVDQDAGTSVRGVAQGVTEEGVPLCLQCQRPYSNPLLSHKTISSPENAWQLRLCSFSCMDKYWTQKMQQCEDCTGRKMTLSRGGYCRDQVFDLQRGVCQLCGLEAHSLFSQVRVTKSLKARADLIRTSPYRSLASTQRERMVKHPQAGQFWHVDHITPVWQGGGLCDLDNLRTLCTPCHLKVTRSQAGQRVTFKKLSGAAGQADITAFFQRS